ncbi:MAG: diaminopimelate epimerase [Bacteroidota bacterium]|nr:diaminopimelate epimerase [Bacteroidota bacterium]
MQLKFYKYQAAGNDFILLNEMQHSLNLSEAQIEKLCNRRFGIGADGVIFLRPSTQYDFTMVYHNADGKLASMCGNGGRSIVRFADDLGLIKDSCRFNAVDGEHAARILDEQVKLKMIDVTIPQTINPQLFETGSPHYVEEVSYLSDFNVVSEGRKIRFDSQFEPDGCNVNFIEAHSPIEIYQRTYERGVEDETLACGTGAVAGAVYQAIKHELYDAEILVHMQGGALSVNLHRNENRFVNIWLSGPVRFVFEGMIEF